MTYSPKETVTVSALNQYIKTLFEHSDILQGIWVRGEISNLKYHTSGHIYFSLKDEEGLLRAVMFRSSAIHLPVKLQNGMKVVAYGSISVYVRDGQYQLYATKIEPDGVGALYAAFEKLKIRLQAEGLFDPARKKPIPSFPQKVGLITSATGAAVQDMIQIIGRRCPLTEIYLRPAMVQGPAAPVSLMNALRFFETEFPVDVIIIGRGGGSIEDLWGFNDEQLAYSIASCQTPIISAVGHETDFTICDFVADLRAPTPSAAAELAVPDLRQLFGGVEGTADRLTLAMGGILHKKRAELTQLISRTVLERSELLTRDLLLTLDSLETKMQNVFSALLSKGNSILDTQAAKLEALSPKKVMERGYVMLTNGQGSVVRAAKDLSEGESISITMLDGRADATVTKITNISE